MKRTKSLRKFLYHPAYVSLFSMVLAILVLDLPPRAQSSRYIDWSKSTRKQLSDVLRLLNNQNGSLPIELLRESAPELRIELRSAFIDPSLSRLALSSADLKEGVSQTGLQDFRLRVERIIRILNALENSTFVQESYRLPPLASSELFFSVFDSTIRLQVGVRVEDLKMSQDQVIVRLMQEYSK